MRDTKLTIWWMRTLGVVLALGGSAIGQQAAASVSAGKCSEGTLFGDYGAQIEGTLLAPNWQLRTMAIIHFDGSGDMTYLHYRVSNGKPVTPDWVPDTGTYSVNPDCTASATFHGPIPTHLVVTNDGKDFRGVVDGDAITLVGSRVR